MPRLVTAPIKTPPVLLIALTFAIKLVAIKLVELLVFAGLDTRSSLKAFNRNLSVNWKLRVDRYAMSIPLPCALAIATE